MILKLISFAHFPRKRCSRFCERVFGNPTAKQNRRTAMPPAIPLRLQSARRKQKKSFAARGLWRGLRHAQRRLCVRTGHRSLTLRTRNGLMIVEPNLVVWVCDLSRRRIYQQICTKGPQPSGLRDLVMALSFQDTRCWERRDGLVANAICPWFLLALFFSGP